jgi:hypothetical protein
VDVYFDANAANGLVNVDRAWRQTQGGSALAALLFISGFFVGQSHTTPPHAVSFTLIRVGRFSSRF